MKIIALLLALLGPILKIVSSFIKSPEEKQQQMLEDFKNYSDELAKAMDKAKDEKDPSDLSRLINRKR